MATSRRSGRSSAISLSNALNYAPGTPIKLQADWAQDESEQRQVFISVLDGGPGVPNEEQDLIFQKFVRGSAAKTERASGSGIGLALCRALAQKMGGAVGVESPSANEGTGPGSSFYLWIPLVRGQSSGRPVDPPASQLELGALIVDDEDYNRTVLEGLSRELGYTPISTPDPTEALSLVDTDQFAVIFLDLELKGANGCELARKIRAMPTGGQAIIVAVTGSDSDEARQSCQEAGMDGFLLKPVSVDDVKSVISRAKRGPWRALELYAKSGAGTREDAGIKFLEALGQEMTAIQLALKDEQRETIRSAAHRLRALGALVHDEKVNRSAAHLQDIALSCALSDLFSAITETTNDVERLKVALTRSGVGALGRNSGR